MNCEQYNVTNNCIEAYGLSVTGQVRKANEDSFGFATVPNGELFVVCDGMGGHVGGATASKIAVEQIILHFKSKQYTNVYQALDDALCRANKQILSEAAANPSLKGMGTTACVVLISGNDAYIAHVGDSRIYLYEALKSRLFRITKDHSLVQALVDQGQLDDRRAEHHPQKNVILKALGTKEGVVPEVYSSPVQPAKDDIFLICSDGLSGMIDDNGIEAILSSSQTTEQKTIDLVTNANLPGKGLDNITAQLIKVLDSPYPVSNHPDHNPAWRNEPQACQEIDYSLNVNTENDSQTICAFPPEEKRKPMDSKWLAAIIVGAMLIIGGGIGCYKLINTSDLGELEKERVELEQKKREYEDQINTLKGEGLPYSTEKRELDNTNKKLEDVKNRIQTQESNTRWYKNFLIRIKSLLPQKRVDERGKSPRPSENNSNETTKGNYC